MWALLKLSMEEGTIWPCQSNWVLLQLEGWGVRRRPKRRAKRPRCAVQRGSIVARCGGASGCPKSSGLQGLGGVAWFAPVVGSQSHGLGTGIAMFALHERRLVPGRDSQQGSPKASIQDRTRGPPSHMVRSGAAPNSQASIPRHASPRAHGCHVGWSVVHHSSLTCAAERARRRGSVPNLKLHARSVPAQEPCCPAAPKHEPAANRSVPIPMAECHGARASAVPSPGSGGRRLRATSSQSEHRPRRANRPCPNNVATPPNCPCVFASLRSWLLGSRGGGCFPMPFERKQARSSRPWRGGLDVARSPKKWQGNRPASTSTRRQDLGGHTAVLSTVS